MDYIGEFIFESVHKKGVQMAFENEIIAIKLDIVLRGGRFFFGIYIITLIKPLFMK